MSKASEYANKKPPTFEGWAKVTDYGDFNIEGEITLRPDDAICFAKWIIETFSDNPKETCEQWAKEISK